MAGIRTTKSVEQKRRTTEVVYAVRLRESLDGIFSPNTTPNRHREPKRARTWGADKSNPSPEAGCADHNSGRGLLFIGRQGSPKTQRLMDVQYCDVKRKTDSTFLLDHFIESVFLRREHSAQCTAYVQWTV